MVPAFILICALFKVAVSALDFVASNGRVDNEVEGSGHGFF